MQNREFDFSGKKVRGYAAGIEGLCQKAEAYSDKGPVESNRQAYIILGPSAAGKSTIAENIASNTKSGIVDVDDEKSVLPEYAGGLQANAVHEESTVLGAKVLAHELDKGNNIVLPKVGINADGIQKLADRLSGAGYAVHLVNMKVSNDVAFGRMVGRFVRTGRLIPSDYFRSIGDRPTHTYNAIKNSGSITSYAEVNGDEPRGQQTAEGNGKALDALSSGFIRKHSIGRHVGRFGQAPRREIEKFDQDQPRDAYGRWTSGGPTNIEHAVSALRNGGKVELHSIGEVPGLVAHIGQESKRITEETGKPPVFDLADVRVPGTKLFAGNSFGVPRASMPQIPRNLATLLGAIHEAPAVASTTWSRIQNSPPSTH